MAEKHDAMAEKHDGCGRFLGLAAGLALLLTFFLPEAAMTWDGRPSGMWPYTILTQDWWDARYLIVFWCFGLLTVVSAIGFSSLGRSISYALLGTLALASSWALQARPVMITIYAALGFFLIVTGVRSQLKNNFYARVGQAITSSAIVALAICSRILVAQRLGEFTEIETIRPFIPEQVIENWPGTSTASAASSQIELLRQEIESSSGEAKELA